MFTVCFTIPAIGSTFLYNVSTQLTPRTKHRARPQHQPLPHPFRRERHPPGPHSVADARIADRDEDVPELLIGEDAVAAIRDDAEKDDEEGKDVGDGVGEEEVPPVVAVPIYGLPADDFGGGVVANDAASQFIDPCTVG